MKSDTAARILLIEDNAADVDLMKYALDKGRFHYELSTLKDGAEAWAFIRKEGKYAHAPQPDLIVMDLHLPKNDGMKFWRRFAGARSSPISPVAAVLSSLCVAGREKQCCRA